MKVTIPETYENTIQRQGQEPEKVSVPSGHTGSVILPDAWTGKDWQEWPNELGFTAWMEQWKWVKARVIDWQIDDLPTNPMQLKDNDLPWHLMNFITRSAYAAMQDYSIEQQGQWDDSLVMPEPGAVTAGEFMAYTAAAEETAKKEEKGDRILAAFREYRSFVRQWPDGMEHSEDGLDVDLSLIMTVVDRGNEILKAAINLGNLLAPRGGRLPKKKISA